MQYTNYEFTYSPLYTSLYLKKNIYIDGRECDILAFIHGYDLSIYDFCKKSSSSYYIYTNTSLGVYENWSLQQTADGKSLAIVYTHNINGFTYNVAEFRKFSSLTNIAYKYNKTRQGSSIQFTNYVE